MLSIFVIGSAFLAVSLTGHSHLGLTGILVGLAVTIGGLYESLYAFTSEVLLYQDAIEARSLFGSKKLAFQNIRGRRESITGRRTRTAYLKIESNDGGLYSLSFEKQRDFDEVFFDWFNRLPDLDVIEPISK